jgi:hypothetical protein
MLPQRPGKRADERGQYRPVRPRQTRLADLPTQHRDLVAQHHQIGEHRRLASADLRQLAEHSNRGQVQQPNNHAADPARQPQKASSHPVRPVLAHYGLQRNAGPSVNVVGRAIHNQVVVPCGPESDHVVLGETPGQGQCSV